MRSRVLLLALALVAAAAGCRDIVTPEGAMNGTMPDLRIQVVGLGSDGLLSSARVRIDNSAYVPATRAAVAETVSISGIATFEDMRPGLYDVEVEPALWLHNTPAWTESAVLLGDSVAVVAYVGLPCEFLVDWPELDAFAPATRATRVIVSWPTVWDPNLVPVVGGGSQTILPNERGEYRGFMPFEGQFEVRFLCEGPGFTLNYIHPGLIAIARDDQVVLDSPIRSHPLDLRFAGEAFTAPSVVVEQRQDHPLSTPGYGYVRYTIDRGARPDSVFLVDAATSALSVSWASGPAFLERAVWLAAGPQSPGVIELGNSRIDLQVTDASGGPVEARVRVGADRRSGSWTTDVDGRLELRLMPGSHWIGIEADDFAAEEFILDVAGDEDLEVVLEAVGS